LLSLSKAGAKVLTFFDIAKKIFIFFAAKHSII
jgi:hypothetical protein